MRASEGQHYLPSIGNNGVRAYQWSCLLNTPAIMMTVLNYTFSLSHEFHGTYGCTLAQHIALGVNSAYVDLKIVPRSSGITQASKRRLYGLGESWASMRSLFLSSYGVTDKFFPVLHSLLSWSHQSNSDKGSCVDIQDTCKPGRLCSISLNVISIPT